MLRIAPLNDLNQRQKDALISTANRTGFLVEKPETECGIVPSLSRRSVRYDLSADRCEKILAAWLADTDNLGSAQPVFARYDGRILQMRVSDIHLLQDNNPTAPNWICYRIDGDLVPVHILPPDAMARLTTLIKRDAGITSVTVLYRKTDVSVLHGKAALSTCVSPPARKHKTVKSSPCVCLTVLQLKGFEELKFKRHEDVGNYLSQSLAPEIKGAVVVW